MIDDMRMFDPGWSDAVDYPTRSELVQWADKRNFWWTIEHDIVIAGSRPLIVEVQFDWLEPRKLRPLTITNSTDDLSRCIAVVAALFALKDPSGTSKDGDRMHAKVCDRSASEKVHPNRWFEAQTACAGKRPYA
jgi:hypothetical protein